MAAQQPSVAALLVALLAIAGELKTVECENVEPTSVPQFTTIYGSEPIRFYGFNGLNQDSLVECKFVMPNGQTTPSYRKVAGFVVDTTTVGCMAPILLPDDGEGYVLRL
jgi:hypothetical protein